MTICYNIDSTGQDNTTEVIKMLKEMLNYYGFETLEAFGESMGLYNSKDAERLLAEMYEEDQLWS